MEENRKNTDFLFYYNDRTDLILVPDLLKFLRKNDQLKPYWSPFLSESDDNPKTESEFTDVSKFF